MRSSLSFPDGSYPIRELLKQLLIHIGSLCPFLQMLQPIRQRQLLRRNRRIAHIHAFICIVR